MNSRRINSLHLFVLAVGLLLAAGSASAQKIRVTEAVPAEAEQGVLELDVEISGNGFDSSVEAVFLVEGSDTDTGQVKVITNEYISPKKMKSRISIPDTAIIGNYDIEVRASGGRRGKGNTLFKVLEKDAGGGNSDHWEEVPLCISVVNSEGSDMSGDGAGPYCDGAGSRAVLESFEGSLRFQPNSGSRKNPSDRGLRVSAQGCTDRACDEDTEVGSISTEREHRWDGTSYVAGETAVFWDMRPPGSLRPGEVIRVEGKILLDRYRAFQYSTPYSDRITCPTILTAPMWLSCDGKVGDDPSTTCDLWTLSSIDLGPDDADDGSGDASPCLDNDQRSRFIEDVVELDFTIAICVMDESCFSH